MNPAKPTGSSCEMGIAPAPFKNDGQIRGGGCVRCTETKTLEDQHSRLIGMCVDLGMDNQLLRDLFSKKGWALPPSGNKQSIIRFWVVQGTWNRDSIYSTRQDYAEWLYLKIQLQLPLSHSRRLPIQLYPRSQSPHRRMDRRIQRTKTPWSPWEPNTLRMATTNLTLT